MNSSIKTTLIKLEEKRIDAWLEKNEKSFLELLADDFQEVNIFGSLDTKYTLQNLFHNLELLKLDISDFQLMHAWEDSSILTYHCQKKLKFKGEEVSGDPYFCSYVKIKGY